MPFIFDDIILLGLAVAPIAGLLGLKKTTDNLDGGSSAKSSYSPAPSYSPPRSAPPQPMPTYDALVYDYGYDQYQDPYGGYSQQGFSPPQNEVILTKTRKNFYADAQYGDRAMHMIIDTGCTYVSVGDEAWQWLRSQGIRSTGASSSNIAGGRTIRTELFTFPYLTLIGSDGNSFVTLSDVAGQYTPGDNVGMLGMSFLGRCNVQISGDQMIIRG